VTVVAKGHAGTVGWEPHDPKHMIDFIDIYHLEATSFVAVFVAAATAS